MLNRDKDIDCYPVIIRRNDIFCVYLPEYNVSGEGDTLEKAFQQFEANKKAIELRSEKYGLATLATDSYPKLNNKSFYRELTLGFVKSAISVFAFVLIVVLLLPNIGATFRYQIKSMIPLELRNAKYWAVQLPAKINAQLDRASTDEKEQMQREWSKLFKRTAPMLGYEDVTDKTKAKHP